VAKGRPDYNIKVVPVVETIGDDEIPYSYVTRTLISLGSAVATYSYTVPANKDLYITYIVISCEGAYIQDFSVYLNGVRIFATCFYIEFCYNSAGNVAFIAEPGDTIEIWPSNNDPVNNLSFYTSVRGFIKTLD
jgi:hypothetical protein